MKSIGRRLAGSVVGRATRGFDTLDISHSTSAALNPAATSTAVIAPAELPAIRLKPMPARSIRFRLPT